MKPDKIGVWYSRDGRTAVVYRRPSDSVLVADVYNADGTDGPAMIRPGAIPGDDWLPGTPPEFPELPPKPPMVYAKGPAGDVEWWMVRSPVRNGPWAAASRLGGWVPELKSLDVIPHPDNDPEAVRLIEDAKHPF